MKVYRNTFCPLPILGESSPSPPPPPKRPPLGHTVECPFGPVVNHCSELCLFLSHTSNQMAKSGCGLCILSSIRIRQLAQSTHKPQLLKLPRYLVAKIFFLAVVGALHHNCAILLMKNMLMYVGVQNILFSNYPIQKYCINCSQKSDFKCRIKQHIK